LLLNQELPAQVLPGLQAYLYINSGLKAEFEALIWIKTQTRQFLTLKTHSPRRPTMYKRLLVATDGSELSTKAVHSAIELSAAIGAELVALYVVPNYPTNYFEGGISISSTEVSQTEKKWAEDGQAIVDKVQQEAAAKGVSAKGATVRSALVAESILSSAKKHGCDLIVMASHGRKGIQRVLLGSETQQVLTHSTIPVLVLR
jgi:nucleotide-binding universal stress UspA family protein